LSENVFTGPIPFELAIIPALEVLRLNNNELTGSIPLLSVIVSLVEADLGFNELQGPISPDLALLQRL
jgi:hypothetical protein